jgi:hypothetical protein
VSVRSGCQSPRAARNPTLVRCLWPQVWAARTVRGRTSVVVPMLESHLATGHLAAPSAFPALLVVGRLGRHRPAVNDSSGLG